MPPSWPLRGADVDVRKSVGVAEARTRRWLLSAAAFLRAGNGGLGGAVALWRANGGGGAEVVAPEPEDEPSDGDDGGGGGAGEPVGGGAR